MANHSMTLALPLHGRGWGGAFRFRNTPALDCVALDTPTPGPSPQEEGGL